MIDKPNTNSPFSHSNPKKRLKEKSHLFLLTARNHCFIHPPALISTLMKPNTQHKRPWRNLIVLLPIIAALILCSLTTANTFASIATYQAPFEKTALPGAINPAPTVAPNVWGWVDPLGLSGYLAIHSSGNGGSSMMSGHSWISYKNDASGTVTTYGTWGNNPTGSGNGLFENLEAGQLGDASRTIHIDDTAETKPLNYINQTKTLGQKGWTPNNPCSGFARNSWQIATGENLNSNWGPINNPTTLKKSIIDINKGANHLSVGSPGKTSSGSSGACGRSSGYSSLRPLGSLL
ncbi:MAG: hypothetical protein KKD44_01005 [Proteobacteria bacterium]|nr:hypothetical protein [Pseudomonadota bacterium]